MQEKGGFLITGLDVEGHRSTAGNIFPENGIWALGSWGKGIFRNATGADGGSIRHIFGKTTTKVRAGVVSKKI